MTLTADLVSWGIDAGAQQAEMHFWTQRSTDAFTALTDRLSLPQLAEARSAMTPDEHVRFDQLWQRSYDATLELLRLAEPLRPTEFADMSLPLRRQIAMAHSCLLTAADLLVTGCIDDARRWLGDAVSELTSLLGRNPYQARQSRSPAAYPAQMRRLETLRDAAGQQLKGLRSLEVA